MMMFVYGLMLYTVLVVLFCSISWQCYYRRGEFLWDGFRRDIFGIWLAGIALVVGLLLEAIVESAKGVYFICRWGYRKFKED